MTPPPEKESNSLGFFGHLEELRSCIIRSCIAVFLIFIGTAIFSRQILEIIKYPVLKINTTGNAVFILTKVHEGFLTQLKAALIAAVFLSFPYLLYQVWKFVAPGLFPNEQKAVLPFIFFASLLFIGGTLFCYFIALPPAMKFFISYASPTVEAKFSIAEYLSFVMRLLIAFGIVFETPVVILFLARIGLVTHDGLKRFRRYVIVLAFVLSALLTPPDIFTQLVLALPFIFLYEISVFLARWVAKRPPEEDELEEG